MEIMATKKSGSNTSARKKGRIQPNVTKAGYKPGHRYGCGGKVKK